MAHPMVPLTTEEIERATAAASAQLDGAMFTYCKILDPPKADVAAWTPGSAALPRVVRLIGQDNTEDGGFEADVTLAPGGDSVQMNPTAVVESGEEPVAAAVDAGAFVDITRIDPSGGSAYGAKDFGTAMRILFSNADWIAALAKRGIAADPEKIQVDPWPAGGFAHKDIPAGHRSMRAICFEKADQGDNGYAKPISGVLAHIDITAKTVVEVEDHGVISVPQGKEGDRYDGDNGHLPEARTDLKPIEIRQPEGVSFTITEGNRIQWLGWDLRTQVDPTHALELRQVSLHGRPLLYRMSVADMVVPYGDSDPMHSWKHVLDATEFGMGTMVGSLELGCDCLGDIHYLDSAQVLPTGDAINKKNAICIHEEDASIAWRHHDGRGGGDYVRRNRRLVVSSWFTVGNYDCE